MNKAKYCFLVLSMLLASSHVFAQAISSPYSSNGIGEIGFQGLPHNFAMGELGIGTPSSWGINIENPALLSYNVLSTFQVGIQADFRKFNTTEGSTRGAGIGLRYMAMSFPLVSRSRWVTSLAILPLSNVNYHTVAVSPLDDDFNTQTDYFGDGGLSQFIWGNGFRVTKNLSLGFRASYIFGSINEEANIKLASNDSIGAISRDDFIVVYKEATSYSDFNFTLGAAYHVKVGEKKYINLGANYNISSDLSGRSNIQYERQNLNGVTIQQQEISSGIRANFELPVSLGFGMSYEVLSKYKVGFDLRTRRWSETNSENGNEVLRNTRSISIGTEYTPDYENVSSYLARSKYRLGINYNESPYIINNRKINDFGINFGIALPMISASSLDLGFKYGIRGTTKDNLIRENYFQFVLGATINDRWFQKRRYD